MTNIRKSGGPARVVGGLLSTVESYRNSDGNSGTGKTVTYQPDVTGNFYFRAEVTQVDTGGGQVNVTDVRMVDETDGTVIASTGDLAIGTPVVVDFDYDLSDIDLKCVIEYNQTDGATSQDISVDFQFGYVSTATHSHA